jgi:hypothetical protein
VTSFNAPFGDISIDESKPNHISGPPMVRRLIETAPGWTPGDGVTQSEYADRIVSTRSAEITQFMLGQRQNYLAGSAPVYRGHLDLPQLRVMYDAAFGQEIITLTVVPANVINKGRELATFGFFDIDVPFTGWPIAGFTNITDTQFPNDSYLYDPFFTPTVPTADNPDIPAMADPAQGGTGIFNVFLHSEGGAGAGYYDLEWLDANGPSGFVTDPDKGTFNKNGVPSNWWTAGVGGSGICVTALDGLQYWEIKILKLPTNVPDTQTFHAKNGDDDQQSWTQTPEEYLSEGTIMEFFPPTLNTFFSPCIGLVTQEYLDPRWKKNTVAYGGVIGLDPDPKPMARTIGMTRLSTLVGPVESGDYIPDSYRVDKPFKLKFVPIGGGALGGSWEDDTILMDDDIFLNIGRGLARSPQGKPLTQFPDPYPWGLENIVVQGTTIKNLSSDGSTDGQYIYCMWAIGPGTVNGPLNIGDVYNTRPFAEDGDNTVVLGPFDQNGPMQNDEVILFPLTLGEACFVCCGQVGGPVWGKEAQSPGWITNEVELINNESVAPLWTWQIDAVQSHDAFGFPVTEYVAIQTENSFLTYLDKKTGEVYHLNGGTVMYQPGQNKVNNSFEELFGDLGYGYSDNKTTTYSPIYKGRLDCLPVNASPADDSPISNIGQNGVWSGIDLGPLAVDDVIMMATDTHSRKVWYGKNGRWHDQDGPSKKQPGDKNFPCAMLMDGDHSVKYYPAASFRLGPTHMRMYFGVVQKYQPPPGFSSYGVLKIDLPEG